MPAREGRHMGAARGGKAVPLRRLALRRAHPGARWGSGPVDRVAHL
jgi:hypothetical protein